MCPVNSEPEIKSLAWTDKIMKTNTAEKKTRKKKWEKLNAT